MKSHSLKLNFLSYCSVTFHAGWGYDFVFVCRYIKKLFQHLKQLCLYCNHNVFHFTNQLIRWRIKVCLTCLMATFAFRNSTKERYYLFRYEPFLWCYEDDSFWGLKPRFFFHLEEPTTQFLSTRQSKSTKSYTNKSLNTQKIRNMSLLIICWNKNILYQLNTVCPKTKCHSRNAFLKLLISNMFMVF